MFLPEFLQSFSQERLHKLLQDYFLAISQSFLLQRPPPEIYPRVPPGIPSEIYSVITSKTLRISSEIPHGSSSDVLEGFFFSKILQKFLLEVFIAITFTALPVCHEILLDIAPEASQRVPSDIHRRLPS